jgi:hypothetical protein
VGALRLDTEEQRLGDGAIKQAHGRGIGERAQTVALRRVGISERARRFDIVAAGAAPGLLAGTLVAGLIFFLNPHLPFAPGPVARALAFYGAVFGMVSLILHLPFTWRRRRRARRIVPWSFTVVLAAFAASDASHASHFAYYLPPGINDRLLKAGLWLGLAAVVSFYTALVHTLQRRPYGKRSRGLYLALAAASVYVQLERREAFRAPPAPTPAPTRAEASRTLRLCVVGLETATLDAVLPLAEQGELPYLASLLRRGAYARLSSLTPTRRPALWTTLASGKYPYKHGIVDPQVFPAEFLGRGAVLKLLPRGLAFRSWGVPGSRPQRVDSRSGRALALWEILARLDIAAGLVGWPLTSPPPRELSFALSDRFFGPARPGPAAGDPEELAERALLFRVEPEDLDPALRARFGEPPPEGVLRPLVNDAWRESVSLFLLQQRPEVEVLFVVLPGLSSISRNYYGGYQAAQFEAGQEPRVRAAARAVAAYYAHLDDTLARLTRQGQGFELVAVVSAYGVEGAAGWRRLGSELRRRPILDGRFDGGPDGLLLLAGRGVREGEFLGPARIVDVAPTLLYALGLPVAGDMDGRVLTGAFTPDFLATHPLNFLPSYEALTASPPAAP